MKKILIRLLVVSLVAAFPAMCIALGLPGIIDGAQGILGISQPSQVIDLSGPKITRACPAGMELKTTTDTRPNFNRTGIVTTVSYDCVGADGKTAKPTEDFAPNPNRPPTLAEKNFFFSPAADWLRWLAYPISFILVMGLSFFVHFDPNESDSDDLEPATSNKRPLA